MPVVQQSTKSDRILCQLMSYLRSNLCDSFLLHITVAWDKDSLHNGVMAEGTEDTADTVEQHLLGM